MTALPHAAEKDSCRGLVASGRPVGELVKAAHLANGLIVLSAGSDVLRLVPPLVITEKDIDEMVEKLEAGFNLSRRRLKLL